MRRARPLLLASVAMLSVFSSGVHGQQPSSTPPTGSTSSAPSKTGQSPSKKNSHANDFLIVGTVFTEKSMALPGVRLRFKRAGDNKFRWETYSNSRGEFAMRVPQGADYEMAVHAKGYVDQARKIDAKVGDLEAGIVFRMQPVGGKQ